MLLKSLEQVLAPWRQQEEDYQAQRRKAVDFDKKQTTHERFSE